MNLEAPQVTVDAEILWLILQGYKGMLDNECVAMSLEQWRSKGFYSPEYSSIAWMEEQIKGIL